MGEVVHGPLVDDFLGGVVHGLEVVLHHLAAGLVGDLGAVAVLAQGVGGDDLVDLVSPAAVVDHQVAELLGNHVVEDIVGDLGVVLGLGEESLHIVALIVDAGEELLLVVAGVEVLDHALLAVGALVGDVEGRGDDDLVVLLDRTVDGDVDLAILALDLLDVGVEAGWVLEVVVELLPDVLGAVLPGPEVDLDEVHGGLEVQILQHVGRGDLVKVAVAEGGVGSDPHVLHEVDAVLGAELFEGQSQILEVGVDALDALAARGHGIAVVAALGDAAVAVEVIALVLGLQQLTELPDLSFHSEQARDLEDVLLGLEGLDDVALGVFVVAVELRAVVGDAAELLHVVHGVVGGHAHDGAHLIAAALVGRRPALAAHAVKTLEDGVVEVTLLFQVHARGQARRAAADDADARIFVHKSLQIV